MYGEIFKGLMIPFLGTFLGAFCVFFMRNKMSNNLQKILNGFAGGVMVAASIWSLIIPAINKCEHMGAFSFIPAVVGFWSGIMFLLLSDSVIEKLYNKYEKNDGKFNKIALLVLAVTIHNIPEGMAVGVVYSGLLLGDADITLLGALALSIGIAIQNFPEGAIISMPLKASGMKTSKSFSLGVLSGIVEPIGGFITILCASLIVPLLPFFLSFAAGAMIYVVVNNLIPEISTQEHSNLGVIFFSVGFTIMMTLDVALG